jgi:hypothetical protein
MSFGNLSERAGFKNDLLHSFITGMRFDMVVLTYSLVLLFIVSGQAKR